MHSINGLVWGNLPGLVMVEGETIRWHIIVILGTEPDVHTLHWREITGIWESKRTDVVNAQPAQLEIIDLTIDNLGTWMFHCHIDDWMDAGMNALFTILPKGASQAGVKAAIRASIQGKFSDLRTTWGFRKDVLFQ